MPNTETMIKPNVDLKEPPMFVVIYMNDNKTTVEFVIESLETYFGYSSEESHKIAADVHTNGSANVAVLPFQIAEQKGIEVTIAARNAGYPLQVKIQREDA